VTKKKMPDVERQAYTVDEFCEAYRISRVTLYREWKGGGGPRKNKVRGRVTITVEDAQAWARGREPAPAA
jgi:hypothetical protein